MPSVELHQAFLGNMLGIVWDFLLQWCTGLFLGLLTARGSGGRVGSGQEVFETSRVGMDRVRKFSKNLTGRVRSP